MGAKIDGGTLVVTLEVDNSGFDSQLKKATNKAAKEQAKAEAKRLQDTKKNNETIINHTTRLIGQFDSKLGGVIGKTTNIANSTNKISSALGGVATKAGAIGLTIGGIATTAYAIYKVEDFTNKLYQRRVNYLGDVLDRTKNVKNIVLDIGENLSQAIQNSINDMKQLYNTTINTAKAFDEFVEPAASFTESLNVVDRAFKENGDGVVRWASTLKTQFGMVQNDATKIASTYGLLLSNYGFDNNITDEYSRILTALVGDWSSLTDTSHDTMAGYFSSAIFGSNTRQLRNLGIDLGAAAMQQFMLDKGIQGTYNSLTQEEKIILKLQKTVESSNIAIGDFQRTQRSWSNQTRILTNTLKQIQTYLGQGFVSVAGNAIYMINVLLNKIQQVAYTFSYVMKLIFGNGGLGQATGSIGGTLSGAIEEGYDAAAGTLESTADKAANKIKNALLGIDDITKLGSESGASSSLYPNGLGVPSLESGIYDKLFGEFTPDENVLIFFDEIYNTIMKIKTMIDHFKEGWRELGERLTPFKVSVGELYNNFLKPMGAFQWESLKQFHDKFLLKVADFALTDENGLIRLNNVLSDFGKKVNWEQLNYDFGNLCETSATIANMAFTGIISLIDRLTQKYDRNSDSLLSQINSFFANLLFGEDLAKGYLEAQKNNNIIESRSKRIINGVSAYGTNGGIPGTSIKTNSLYDNTFRNPYKNNNVETWQQKIYHKMDDIIDQMVDTFSLIAKGGDFETFMHAILTYIVTGNSGAAVGAYLEDAGMKSGDAYKQKYGKKLRQYGEWQTTTDTLFGEDNFISRIIKFMQLREMKRMPEFVDTYATQAAEETGNSAMQETKLYKETMNFLNGANEITTKLEEMARTAAIIATTIHNPILMFAHLSGVFENLTTENIARWQENLSLGLGNIGLTFDEWKENLKLKFDDIKLSISNKLGTLGDDFGINIIKWKADISKGLLTLRSSVKSGFTNIINGAIELINKGIGYINKIPGVNVGTIGLIKGYANGGVFEPRNEKIIRVGDNKKEREVISPLSLMKQAMRETMLESGGFGGNNREIVIHNYMTTDGQVLAQATNRYNESNNWRQYAY